MPIGSGTVRMSEIRAEWGRSGTIKMSEMYRGGSHVLAKAGNNGSTNLAASVPTSGAIRIVDFRDTAKGFRKTYSSGATNQDASSVFGSDYGVNYPKEIVVNSGVELGATSTSQEALQIDSGLAGGLTITNNGTLSGAGGAAGSAGGDAFQADVACTLINNGTIRAGGGGGGSGGSGGSGGTGGQGQTSSTAPGSWSGYQSSLYNPQYGVHWYQQGGYSWYWGNNSVLSTTSATSMTHGGYNYERSGSASYHYIGSFTIHLYPSRRRQASVTSYTYHNGGAGGAGGGGGAGGVGQGYGQSAGSGASGSGGSGGAGGGTNAGSGGTGGTGGSGGAGGGYGASGSSGNTGSTGNTGANGNHTNGSGGSGGSGGSSGAAAGKYIRGLSNVTLTQNGTVQGGTA